MLARVSDAQGRVTHSRRVAERRDAYAARVSDAQGRFWDAVMGRDGLYGVEVIWDGRQELPMPMRAIGPVLWVPYGPSTC